MCTNAEDTTRAINTWDRLARRYDVLIAPFEKLLFRKWRRRTLAELATGRLVLEVGAGTGLNFEHYPPDARGVASELSYGMITRASSRPRPAGIKLLVADVQRLPFRDQTFGQSVATLVFCSVPDDQAGFAELCRVLRVGGRFVAFEHVRPKSVAGWLSDRINRLTVAAFGDHVNRQPEETLRSTGWSVDRAERGAGSVLQFISARKIFRLQ